MTTLPPEGLFSVISCNKHINWYLENLEHESPNYKLVISASPVYQGSHLSASASPSWTIWAPSPSSSAPPCKLIIAPAPLPHSQPEDAVLQKQAR